MPLAWKIVRSGLLAATASACSGGLLAPTGTPAPAEASAADLFDNTGSIRIALSYPDRDRLRAVSYMLSSGAIVYDGQRELGGDGGDSLVIDSLAATATPYQLTLSATTDDGALTCTSPALGGENPGSITVTSNATTTVAVTLYCMLNTNLDDPPFVIDAALGECPVWTSIVGTTLAVPADALDAGSGVDAAVDVQGDAGVVTAWYPGDTAGTIASIPEGQELVLVGAATPTDAAALAFHWAATGGTLVTGPGGQAGVQGDAGLTNQVTFACPPLPADAGASTQDITLTLTGGFDAGACDTNFTTAKLVVVCNAP
jgi:hypothetical protein